MGPGPLVVQEQTGGFEHHVGTDIAPTQGGWIALGGDTDAAAIHHQGTVIDGHLSGEAAVGGVVAKHISDVIDIDQVVDAHHFDVIATAGDAEDQTADASEPIDANPDGHLRVSRVRPRFSASHGSCHRTWRASAHCRQMKRALLPGTCWACLRRCRSLSLERDQAR